MRLVLQRVARASVEVDGERIAAIGNGVVALIGVGPADDRAVAEAAAEKVARMRLFDDAEGRMNLDLGTVGGSVLVVSQFTLLADLRRGRRPSFVGAAPPETARPVVEAFVGRLRELGCPVETGRFGAHMRVELVNDGPVTLQLDLPAGDR